MTKKTISPKFGNLLVMLSSVDAMFAFNGLFFAKTEALTALAALEAPETNWQVVCDEITFKQSTNRDMFVSGHFL